MAYGAACGSMAVSLNMLLTALARATKQRMGEFTVQSLANTTWALAKAGQLDAALSVALARAAERRMGEFKPQELTRSEGQVAASVHLRE